MEASGGATVGGQKVAIGVPGLHAEWLKKWLLHCVLKLRPLALQVGWVWAVAAATPMSVSAESNRHDLTRLKEGRNFMVADSN